MVRVMRVAQVVDRANPPSGAARREQPRRARHGGNLSDRRAAMEDFGARAKAETCRRPPSPAAAGRHLPGAELSISTRWPEQPFEEADVDGTNESASGTDLPKRNVCAPALEPAGIRPTIEPGSQAPGGRADRLSSPGRSPLTPAAHQSAIPWRAVAAWVVTV